MGKGLIPAAADTVVKIIMQEDDGRESTGFSIDDLVAEDADDDDVGAGYTRGGGVAA